MTFEIGLDDNKITFNKKGMIKISQKEILRNKLIYTKESKDFNNHLKMILWGDKIQVKKTPHNLTNLKERE